MTWHMFSVRHFRILRTSGYRDSLYLGLSELIPELRAADLTLIIKKNNEH